MSVVLELRDIYKRFLVSGRSVEAVNGVSLHIGERETVGLVGESGCGKSTLARLITRLDTPDSGTISLCGEELTHLHGTALRKAYANIKMIFQEPRSSFDPRMTLGASIQETLKAAGVPRPARASEIERLLCEAGLDGSYAKVHPTDVSGGECQRAAIARAIATRPKLLICDECTSALDVSVQAQIMALLRALRDTHDMAFLFISHDLALVSSFCDRSYVMKNGEIVEQGITAQIIGAPRHEYTRALIASALPTH